MIPNTQLTRRQFLTETISAAVVSLVIPRFALAAQRKMQMKLSFMTFVCPTWPIEKIVKFAKEAGYDGVEIRVDAQHKHDISSKSSAAVRRQTKKLFADAGVEIAAVATHFADVEDTTDHAYARRQLATFREGLAALREEGLPNLKGDIANSAATILWPEAHVDMVRVGISAYGMWPSTETFVSAALTHRDRVVLRPALTWKTRVAQVKTVPAGKYVGYGRTYRTTHDTRIAVLPVGYYDGYDRRLSGAAYVLVRGMRAQVRGRVCMNMVMVDVGDVPGVRAGDEVVLIGRSGDDAVTAEQFASWAGTINYEVTTRIAESVPRIAV